MRIALILAVFAAAAGCGKEIGDKCVLGSDCDPNGERQCDTSSKEGYCTIQGCSFDSCPEEAACVRFFTGSFSNKACDPMREDVAVNDEGVIPNDCSFDELCALSGFCASRSSEIRACMRVCSSQDDCRDGYECRDLELMKAHGGQPVLGPDVVIDETSPKFCAASPG